ncbi:MAG: SIR2 family protein [Halanaerobiales bacterium]
MVRNISFLFGAGISIPAGLPSTNMISKRINSGQAKVSFLNNKQDIVGFLQIIKRRVENFGLTKAVNYEDLYYICAQLKDFWQEYDNPLVLSFIDELINNLQDLRLLRIADDKNLLRKEISKIAELSLAYMDAIVMDSLSINDLNMSYLNFLDQIYQDNNIAFVNILSLNHDILVERYLHERNIPFYDGFKENDELPEIRKWYGEFNINKNKIKLLKLHGSISWYRFRDFSSDNNYNYFFASEKLGSLKNLHILSKRKGCNPIVLTGRLNKILEYNRSIYVDLHYHFYSLLKKTEIIIISGYSFNDLGINSWLIDWLHSSRENKIYLIHPEPDRCISKARPGIQNHYVKWQQDKFIKLSIPIEHFNWQEYSRLIL